MKSPAIFLDKDGTLIENVPYNVDPARIRLCAGAGLALPALRDAGYRLVVVSNQSGVARGFFKENDLVVVRMRLEELLASMAVRLDGFYYCPHHPLGAVNPYAVECVCRKPRPGLFHIAAAELGLDLAQSWMIGDILDDVEAGHAAGCRTVLIDNGNETEWKMSAARRPDFSARNLAAAASHILARSEVLCR